MTDLTGKQLHTLRHMLGINDPCRDRPEPYRNYAAVNSGDPEFLELERLGMVKNTGQPSWSDYDCYVCTDEGKRAAISSFKTIQYSRSKRRYRKFLQVKDVCSDLTMGEFLKNEKVWEGINEN